jgi:serine/threonine-protein kinase
VTCDRWTETREVFHAALDQAADQRAAFLDRRCGGDQALRLEVNALLEADALARGGAFIRDVVRDSAEHLVGMRESGLNRRLPR